MRKMAYLFVFVGLCIAFSILASVAQAITIRYEVVNLPDTVPGEDLWQYTYHVSDHTFSEGHGFTIYFSHATVDQVETPPPAVNADWELVVWQPDFNIPDDGAYNAVSVTSNVDGASLADGFTVSFVRLGAVKPDSQFFDVFVKEPFQLLETGVTVPLTGDVNGDGSVNTADGVAILQYVVGLINAFPVAALLNSAPTHLIGDVSGDDTVSAVDAALVFQRIVGVIDRFPVEDEGGEASPLRTIPVVTAPWDVNGDTQVDIFDLALVGTEFGGPALHTPAADVNGDGTVNLFDLVLVGRHFGDVYTLAAAPLLQTPSSSTGPAISMKLSASNTNANPSPGFARKRVTVQIYADTAAGTIAASQLRGFRLDLGFDPKHLSVVEAEEGNFFAPHSSFWLPPKVIDGRLRLVSVALNAPSLSMADQTTVLAQAAFQVKGDFDAAIRSIYLGNAYFVDEEGQAIIAEVRHVETTEPVVFATHHLQNALFQNYPNPFNPETWIPYELAEAASVNIHIYNAQGEPVRVLDSGFRPAGAYKTRTSAAYWDGRNQNGEPVSSGLYYYTIQAGNFTATRKMLVVK